MAGDGGARQFQVLVLLVAAVLAAVWVLNGVVRRAGAAKGSPAAGGDDQGGESS